MKKLQIILILFCIILVSGCAKTGTVKKIETVLTISEEKVIDDMAALPRFHVRKRFTYLIAWNSIPVGSITAEVGDIKKFQGRDVYVVKLVTESNKFLSKIYRVEDTYVSFVDAETMSSRRYEADRKEGNYRKHVVVEYEFDKMEAIYTNHTDGSVKRCSIEKNVQDPLSAMCYFMTLPIKLGEKMSITINLNEKNYIMFAKVEDLDVIKLNNVGTYPAFKIRPYAELSGERVKKGKAWMYFSADANRYPLYGVVIIPFGRVTATLKSVEDV